MKTTTTRGFTLVEVMLSMAMLAMIALAIYGLIDAGTNSYNTTKRRDQLQQNARTALEMLAEELRLSDPTGMTNTQVTATTPVALYKTNILVFQKAVSYTPPPVDPNTGEPVLDSTGTPLSGTTAYGNSIRYFVEASPVDSNNNGIQDEGRLIRAETQPDGTVRRGTICDYVQPGGFVVVDNGDTITLTLKLRISDGRLVSGKYKVLEATASTTVLHRNRKIGS